METILSCTNNFDINQKDRYENTALCYAVMTTKEQTVNLLLKNRANPKNRSTFGEIPMDYSEKDDLIYGIFKKLG